jgi:cysteine desulfurase
VNARGDIDLAHLESAVGDDTALVTLALVNHELGNVYPVARYATIARARGALMHTDAVQAAGKLAVDLAALGVDAATISAHKIGGPPGMGAVFVRRGLDLPPLLVGGHQERERRPGTENVPGIVGFGVACELARAGLSAERARLERLRRDLMDGLVSISGARVWGCGDEPSGGQREGQGRVPGTVMVSFAGAPGQLVAIGLDLEGICVSTGAACTSGSVQPSAVLRALGLGPDEAGQGLRISLGWTTTAADIRRLGEILPAIVERVRAAVSEPGPFGGGARPTADEAWS